jgi:hypothetical protein
VLKVKPAEPAATAVASQAIELMVRPEKVVGATYKLRWPDSEHAMYVTVNDIEQDGVRRPFEVFVNSKNLEHYAWVVALTRMISAVFRRGGEVAFVAEELKQVFDPRGGQWSTAATCPPWSRPSARCWSGTCATPASSPVSRRKRPPLTPRQPPGSRPVNWGRSVPSAASPGW